MRAAITLKTVRHPVSQKVIGVRLVCAHINEARFDVLSRTYCQSFAPMYIITETGDYTMMKDKVVDRFIAMLKEWHKIDRVEWS